MGRNRRIPRPHPLPAGRHLRRSDDRPRAALGATNFADHEHVDRSLYLFGYGDGGGGPTDAMLESARRLADSEGLPHLTMEGPRAFFDKVEEEITEAPVWVGELYLEHHRGTYTTQGAIKLANRRGELALRDAEVWSTLASGPVPPTTGSMRRGGRCCQPVPRHHPRLGDPLGVRGLREPSSAEVGRTAEEIAIASLTVLSDSVDAAGLEHPVVVWNSLSTGREDVVEVELPADATVAAGPRRRRPLQPVGDGQAIFRARARLRLSNLRPRNRRARSRAVPAEAGPTASGQRHPPSRARRRRPPLVDRRQEARTPGVGGGSAATSPAAPRQPQLLRRLGHRRHLPPTCPGPHRVEVVEVGGVRPVRAALRIRRSFGKSSITQTVSLVSGSPVLHVDNEVDWQERNRLLKVAFPVAVHSPRATYEIQYGHVERPIHVNTSWEAARFEVCAHKWADWSEAGYGVALLNDCKYGYDVTEAGIRLSLLRSPTWPDPEADHGVHRFAYGLLPHPDDLRAAGVVDEGYRFNVPLRVVPTGSHNGTRPTEGSFVGVDASNVFVEVVKSADDGSGALILRLYEAWGGRGPVTVTAPHAIARATRTDLLERELEPVEVERASVRLDLHPFEIVTLRLEAA